MCYNDTFCFCQIQYNHTRYQWTLTPNYSKFIFKQLTLTSLIADSVLTTDEQRIYLGFLLFMKILHMCTFYVQDLLLLLTVRCAELSCAQLDAFAFSFIFLGWGIMGSKECYLIYNTVHLHLSNFEVFSIFIWIFCFNLHEKSWKSME